MMKVADIRAVSEIAKEIGALTVVDNTFLTPYFQKPLTLGADIVTHSSTKFLGGHNDALSGIVVVKDDEEIAEKIHVHIKSHGSQLAPMDSWLVLRGIKTLAVRMDRHNANAKRVAEWLREQPKVQKVYYVGFPDHKDYDVTMKQTTGFGGMISFTVDSFETVKKILKGVDMIMFAESLGGTETLITYPTTQTHEDTPEDVKNALGITDCFLRMSVGIENVEDIIADLDRAMHA
jgi:cystathionine gamma-synthase